MYILKLTWICAQFMGSGIFALICLIISKTIIWQKNMSGIKYVFYLCDICLKHFSS